MEVSINNKKHLIGTFYRSPNSTNQVLTMIEDSIGLAFDTNISDSLITGDFNLDVNKQVYYRKIRDLCHAYGL